MARRTPGNYVPLDVNYVRDGAIRRAGEAAELLFIRSLAYCKGSKTRGFIAEYDLEVVAIGMKNVARRVESLVAHGLWVASPGGWTVRSWERWNNEGDGLQRASEKGNHQRWHVNERKTDPLCEWCRESPGESPGKSPGESPGDIPREGKGREGKGSSRDTRPDATRPDVEALCARLADLIESNGSKRPAITQQWRDDARRMLDLDKRDLHKTEQLIDWCQANAFWRPNIQSMPKFRAKYDQLRLQALAEWERAQQSDAAKGPESPEERRVREARERQRAAS